MTLDSTGSYQVGNEKVVEVSYLLIACRFVLDEESCNKVAKKISFKWHGVEKIAQDLKT